jgi:hypothetical protein
MKLIQMNHLSLRIFLYGIAFLIGVKNVNALTTSSVWEYPGDGYIRVESTGVKWTQNTYYYTYIVHNNTDFAMWEFTAEGLNKWSVVFPGTLIAAGSSRTFNVECPWPPEIGLWSASLNVSGGRYGAGDTTSLAITPEPATLALLGLGSLALIRRRRG